MKNLRFGDLVRQSGRPNQITLWTAPEKHPELQRAIRGNRVLTIHQPNVGTRHDFGTVGFQPARLASYLVFPRRLAAAAGRRVIGVHYALLDQDA